MVAVSDGRFLRSGHCAFSIALNLLRGNCSLMPDAIADANNGSAEAPKEKPSLAETIAAIADPAEAAEANPRQPDSAFPERFSLQKIGLSKKAAMKLLAGGKPDKWLRLTITSRVGLGFTFNSLEQMAAAQKKAVQLANDSKLEIRARTSCLIAAAQLGTAIARTVETNIMSARAIDDPENEADKPPAPQKNIFNFGFPPVVTQARNGTTTDVEVIPEAKSP